MSIDGGAENELYAGGATSSSSEGCSYRRIELSDHKLVMMLKLGVEKELITSITLLPEICDLSSNLYTA